MKWVYILIIIVTAWLFRPLTWSVNEALGSLTYIVVMSALGCVCAWLIKQLITYCP